MPFQVQQGFDELVHDRQPLKRSAMLGRPHSRNVQVVVTELANVIRQPQFGRYPGNEPLGKGRAVRGKRPFDVGEYLLDLTWRQPVTAESGFVFGDGMGIKSDDVGDAASRTTTD